MKKDDYDKRIMIRYKGRIEKISDKERRSKTIRTGAAPLM